MLVTCTSVTKPTSIRCKGLATRADLRDFVGVISIRGATVSRRATGKVLFPDIIFRFGSECGADDSLLELMN